MIDVDRRGAARIAAWALPLVLALSVLGPTAEAQGPVAGAPVLGYWTDTDVVVADGDGVEVRRFPNFGRFSLNGYVLAGELPGAKSGKSRIVAYDATSGERLFRIPDARLPVVAAGGSKVAFFPTFDRDETMVSVWIRTPAGRLRKVAKFKAGPGYSGIRHGMRAGAVPLDIALDESGRTMAIAAGLETIRAFDVWVIDVKTKDATRMTRGANSHNPSLSPDGEQLAVRVESTEPCPDPIYGEILIGKIRVKSIVTGESKTLTGFDCALFYDTPRWIDNESLAAVRVTRDATQTYGYDLDIVKIDVASGEITELVTTGNPCCITVSPSLSKVAYPFSDQPGFSLFDVGLATAIGFPEGTYVPHLSGENRL